MLKQILNYQKIIFFSTYSFQGSMKDWRKDIPDYLSLLPLIVFPWVLSRLLGEEVSSIIISNNILAILPVFFIIDNRLGRNSFFEYLPVSNKFKVLNMFLILLFVGICYCILLTFIFVVSVFLFEIYFNYISSSGPSDYAIMLQVTQDMVSSFSTMLILGSFVLMTCFFKRLLIRISMRLMLAVVMLCGWYLLLQAFPQGVLNINIGWKNNIFMFGLAVFVFVFCLLLTRAFVARSKARNKQSVQKRKKEITKEEDSS